VLTAVCSSDAVHVVAVHLPLMPAVQQQQQQQRVRSFPIPDIYPVYDYFFSCAVYKLTYLLTYTRKKNVLSLFLILTGTYAANQLDG